MIPEYAAAGFAHCRRQPVDRGHNIARCWHRSKSDSIVHKGVLQIDYDERGPRGVEISERVLHTAALNHSLYIASGIVAPFNFIGVPLTDQLGVGASGWSSFAFRRSAHNAGG